MPICDGFKKKLIIASTCAARLYHKKTNCLPNSSNVDAWLLWQNGL
nr:unnamed protein product [Callosobruchus analis]